MGSREITRKCKADWGNNSIPEAKPLRMAGKANRRKPGCGFGTADSGTVGLGVGKDTISTGCNPYNSLSKRCALSLYASVCRTKVVR